MLFSRTGAGLSIYHLLARSNLNFLHISQFSFLFLFPSYCHSVIYHVVSIVSDDRNQSSCFSIYRCVNAVFDIGKSSYPLFSWYL